MSRWEFTKSNHISSETKNNLMRATINGFICVGTYIILGISMNDLLIIILGLVMLLLIIGTHMLKSMTCAIIFLALSFPNFIFVLIMYHNYGGCLPFVASATSIWAIGRLNAEYENFKNKIECHSKKKYLSDGMKTK